MEEAFEFAVVGPTLNSLFASRSWFDVSRIHEERLKDEIKMLSEERILQTPEHELTEFFLQEYLIDVPILNEAEIVVDQREKQIDVSHDRMRYIRDRSRPFNVTGTAIDVEIPFTGDKTLFLVQPTRFEMSPPRAILSDHVIKLEIVGTSLTSDSVKNEIEQLISRINKHLGFLRTDAEKFNIHLEGKIVPQIQARKAKLLGDKDLVASLGFKMKRRDTAKTYVAPVARKKITPKLPAVSSEPFKPEPVLNDEDYNHILGVLDNMATVMELSPSAFETMGEEHLRSHFLVQLNGHFEGNATGETFNYEGKTDILIKVEGRNIFIAECKFWTGEKGLLETIDQILGYLSWRDTKCAILLFSRNMSFSDVVDQIEGSTTTHPHFKKNLGRMGETKWRFLFTNKNDANREITISILLFDIPKKGKA